MAHSVDFALRGVYHIYRGDPADASDDVIECLTREVLINASTGMGPSDLGLDDEEETFGLHVAPEAPINHLPTGVHTVWAVGRVKFFNSTSWEFDDGGSVEVHLDVERWLPADLSEILEAEHAAGVDLSEFKRPGEVFL